MGMSGTIRWWAVMPAAGLGRRMGGATRKPLLQLAGRSILYHSVRAFQRAGCAGVTVVLHPDDCADERLTACVLRECGADRAVCGGDTRQQSVLAGLEASDPEASYVLIHDAVRPLVQRATIDAVLAAACAHGAAIAAVAATDTVKQVDDENRILATPPRSGLWYARTPQGFRRELILEAHRLAADDGHIGTDDAELIERLGGTVVVVPDSPENIKITTPTDLVAAEAILAERRTH
jgi:2-C-methyl-D-erythritol 4-phosphate cytidylyltransferase